MAQRCRVVCDCGALHGFATDCIGREREIRRVLSFDNRRHNLDYIRRRCIYSCSGYSIDPFYDWLFWIASWWWVMSFWAHQTLPNCNNFYNFATHQIGHWYAGSGGSYTLPWTGHCRLFKGDDRKKYLPKKIIKKLLPYTCKNLLFITLLREKAQRET